jgi:Spy/CpxP family protein refolding chaperone
MVGPGGFGAPSPPGQVLSAVTRDILGMTPEQRTRMDELQKDVDAHLDKLLTDDQKTQLKEKPKSTAPGGFGPSSGSGRILASSDQNRLKLTDEQKKELAECQKEVDGKIEKILDEEQRKKIKGSFAFGGPPGGGDGPRPVGGPGGPPQPGQLVPSFLQDALKLNEDQKKQLGAFQKDAGAKLDKLLTDEQRKQFKEPQGGGSMPRAGEFMSPTLQARLKLSADQKKAVQELQKEADDTLAKLFTDDQKKQFKEMRSNVARAPGAPGGPPGFGPQGGSPLFRAYRFPTNYPGLAGKELTPGKTIEELQKEPEKK